MLYIFGIIYFDSLPCVVLMICYTILQLYCTSPVNTAYWFVIRPFFRFVEFVSSCFPDFTVIQRI
jgi:hypothetical protein